MRFMAYECITNYSYLNREDEYIIPRLSNSYFFKNKYDLFFFPLIIIRYTKMKIQFWTVIFSTILKSKGIRDHKIATRHEKINVLGLHSHLISSTYISCLRYQKYMIILNWFSNYIYSFYFILITFFKKRCKQNCKVFYKVF